MEIAMWHKFAQNEDIKQVLLGTGDAEIIVRVFPAGCNINPPDIMPIELQRQRFLGRGKEPGGNKRGREGVGAGEEEPPEYVTARNSVERSG